MMQMLQFTNSKRRKKAGRLEGDAKVQQCILLGRGRINHTDTIPDRYLFNLFSKHFSEGDSRDSLVNLFTI